MKGSSQRNGGDSQCFEKPVSARRFIRSRQKAAPGTVTCDSYIWLRKTAGYCSHQGKANDAQQRSRPADQKTESEVKSPRERRVSRASAHLPPGGCQGPPGPRIRSKFRLFGQGDVSLYGPSKAINFKVSQNAFGAWILACLGCLSAHAQDAQFLPEVDAHLTLNSHVRVYLQAKDDREGGDPHQFTFGPSIQLYLKPLIKLKSVTLFDLDDAKSRPLVLESGYRIITAPNTPNENRAIEAVTCHFPLFVGILLTDRNRADLDWKNGSFTWRYRNKLTLERTFAIRSYHFIPYLAAEPFYESQYKKWSATDLYAGSLFPVPYSLWASTSNSISTMSSKTTPAKSQTGNSIMSG